MPRSAGVEILTGAYCITYIESEIPWRSLLLFHRLWLMHCHPRILPYLLPLKKIWILRTKSYITYITPDTTLIVLKCSPKNEKFSYIYTLTIKFEFKIWILTSSTNTLLKVTWWVKSLKQSNKTKFELLRLTWRQHHRFWPPYWNEWAPYITGVNQYGGNFWRDAVPDVKQGKYKRWLIIPEKKPQMLFGLLVANIAILLLQFFLIKILHNSVGFFKPD